MGRLVPGRVVPSSIELRWRNGQMALRWCAAERCSKSDHQFRRVNGQPAPAQAPRRARSALHPECQYRKPQ
jgi:hypothetical protein